MKRLLLMFTCIICLISCYSTIAQDLENMDLEQWTNGEPQHWLIDFGHGAGMQSGTLNWFESLGEPLSTFEETNNPSGGNGSSARLVSVGTTGALFQSGVPAIPGHLMRWESYHTRPVQFAYDYIVKPTGNDFAAVYIEFFTIDTILVGKAEVYYLTETTNWQREIQTIDWLTEDEIQYMRITCVSSVLESEIQIGSELWVDNFEIIQDNLSISEFEQMSLSIYPNPAASFIQYTINQAYHEIEVTDLSGKIQTVTVDKNNNTITIDNLPKGTYVIAFVTEKKVIRRFFIKQ